MSAGGLSYSMITNHGKTTLPSVDGWSSNLNILRDPPKSYYTRKIDKVGETSSITEMVDESGSRSCEAVQVYARGVNPFVSVSYSNAGSNGGQRAGGITSGINQGQAAKLPYRIMEDGAFRPPVLLQEDLLPLSRLPRNWTSAFAQADFADFSRKMRTCGTAEETKEVHNETLKACVRPTAVYKIEVPHTESFEVKYVIQPSIKNSATSGIRTMDITQKHAGNPTKEIDHSPLHAHAQSNLVANKHVDNNKFDSERYLQETNHQSIASNVSSNKHCTAIEDILDLAELPVHEQTFNINVDAPISGVEQTKYFHDNIVRDRNLPEYNARTNTVNPSIHKRIDPENTIELERNMPMNSFTSNPIARGFSENGSRDVQLAQKIQPGSYDARGKIPTTDRIQHGISVGESEKARMNRIVAESMQTRFDKPSPFGAPPQNRTLVY
jgi:hypothetical protein